MDQIKELLDILKQTPEMALWGLGIYFFFVLAKMASWISALTYTARLFIQRYFDYKDKKLPLENGAEIAAYFDKKKIGSVEKQSLYELLTAIRGSDHGYIHESDINRAIKKIRDED